MIEHGKTPSDLEDRTRGLSQRVPRGEVRIVRGATCVICPGGQMLLDVPIPAELLSGARVVAVRFVASAPQYLIVESVSASTATVFPFVAVATFPRELLGVEELDDAEPAQQRCYRYLLPSWVRAQARGGTLLRVRLCNHDMGLHVHVALALEAHGGDL